MSLNHERKPRRLSDVKRTIAFDEACKAEIFVNVSPHSDFFLNTSVHFNNEFAVSFRRVNRITDKVLKLPNILDEPVPHHLNSKIMMTDNDMRMRSAFLKGADIIKTQSCCQISKMRGKACSCSIPTRVSLVKTTSWNALRRMPKSKPELPNSTQNSGNFQ